VSLYNNSELCKEFQKNLGHWHYLLRQRRPWTPRIYFECGCTWGGGETWVIRS